MARTDFTVRVVNSNRELTLEENLLVKHYTDGEKLKDGVILDIDFFAVCDVHNEYAENADYTITVIGTPDGVCYTSSEAFTSNMIDIYDEVAEIIASKKDVHMDDVILRVKVNSKKSKKNGARAFLTPSLIKLLYKNVNTESPATPFDE